MLQCAASSAALAAASFDSAGGGSSDGGAAAGQRSFPTFLAAIRAVFFYVTTLIFASPLFICMLLVYPFVLMFDKYRCGASRAPHSLLCFSGAVAG